MHTRWRCEVELLVIAPNPRVARWANQPMKLSRGGSQIIPLVLGTEDFPRLDLETLELLAEDLLDFTSPADLDAWLARH